MIYFCIPTHNEEATIGVVLWKLRQVMAEFPRDYQLLVLDDASTDGTEEVLRPYERVLPLTVLRNQERRGYAASLERLLREAVRRSNYPRRDVVVTLQADFTDEPAEVPSLLRRIESGADIVSAAVQLRIETVPRSVRWGRAALGYVLRRAGWPGSMKDPLSGFRAYRVIVLKKALSDRNGAALLAREGWAANAELLRRVGPHARRVDEAPVQMRYDRRHRPTRFQPWDSALQVLHLMRSRDHAPAVAAEASTPLGGSNAEPIAEGGEEEATSVGERHASSPSRRRRGDQQRRGYRRRGGNRRGKPRPGPVAGGETSSPDETAE